MDVSITPQRSYPTVLEAAAPSAEETAIAEAELAADASRAAEAEKETTTVADDTATIVDLYV